MTRYDAEPWLRDLTAFQLRSVNHVIDQFYGPAQASRFLVADETGLGKTLVAKGVIARAIEKTQDTIDRFDVVYVCANSDLARQNIRRLNVTGEKEIPFSSRLTLLGEHSRKLNRAKKSGGGVNLISFTPGTSFDMGHSLGQARERAMIALALERLFDLTQPQRTATHRMLQGTVRKLANFQHQIDSLHWELGDDGIDPAIIREYKKLVRSGGRKGLGGRYEMFMADMGQKRSIPPELRHEALSLVRGLRAALAAASVQTLEPDLVILDEFQRFRHLLDENSPAGELAHHLFRYSDAKVLLLSATPYKPFTLAGEDGEDHARDLYRTLDFLARGRDDANVDQIRSGLRRYRETLLRGESGDEITSSLRTDLLKLMSRAERPMLTTGSMSVERLTTASDIRAEDFADFATMRKVADAVRHPRDQGLVTTEYWKSAPYFLTFADGYQFGRRLRDAESTPELSQLLNTSHHINQASLERWEPLEAGNARMRVLAADTIERGWWKLLWMPSSLSYIEKAGPFADPTLRAMTKRVVFSSWTATPSSVASILSYEAERRAVDGSAQYSSYTPEARAKVTRPLQYTADRDGRPQKMAALLCFWPLRGVANAVDPLAWIATQGGRPLSRDAALDHALTALNDRQSATGSPVSTGERSSGQADSLWRSVFNWADAWPDASDQQISLAISGARPESEGETTGDDSDDIPNGLSHHVATARSTRDDEPPPLDAAALRVLAEVALYSPANIAFRALRRLAQESPEVTETGLFEAAAILANGLRTLFNRPDATQMIDRLGDSHLPYWRKMLAYIADGDLEAVIDEYAYQLFADRKAAAPTDKLLLEIAREIAEAVSLRSPTLRALDASNPQDNIPFAARFALRYGGRQQDAEDARQPEVRRAFNSPFWPFVLASTSVGQEGIDFHWWCHAVFHWNTPSNPVDFEQREGRVDRYRGHAVRKNVADAHGSTALSQSEVHPWARLYELATDHQDLLGDFSPGWVYPGENRIERHIAPFPFSTDGDRYDRMKRDVALYRLTFGQPRQEDMLDVLRRRGVDADPEALKTFRINLAP